MQKGFWVQSGVLLGRSAESFWGVATGCQVDIRVVHLVMALQRTQRWSRRPLGYERCSLISDFPVQMVYASTPHTGGAFQGSVMFDRISADEKLMEREELGQLEAVIERGQQTFVEVRQALAAIRDRRGYRHAGFSTFEQYLQQRWGWSRQRGYQLMQAAEVVMAGILAGAGGMSTRNRRTSGSGLERLAPIMFAGPQVLLPGFSEGEGCFHLMAGRYPRVIATSTDLDVLLKLETLAGAGVVRSRARSVLGLSSSGTGQLIQRGTVAPRKDLTGGPRNKSDRTEGLSGEPRDPLRPRGGSGHVVSAARREPNGWIRDEFCAATGYDRKYGIKLLRWAVPLRCVATGPLTSPRIVPRRRRAAPVVGTSPTAGAVSIRTARQAERAMATGGGALHLSRTAAGCRPDDCQLSPKVIRCVKTGQSAQTRPGPAPRAGQPVGARPGSQQREQPCRWDDDRTIRTRDVHG